MSEPDEVSEEEVAGTIADPVWRLNNLYKITDKKGRVVDFMPNFVQRQLIQDILVDGSRRELVLKSRKHGVSTLFCLMIVDWCYFGQNIASFILDLTAGHASAKLVNIARFAWENFSDEVREKLITDSNKKIEFANGSVIGAGMSTRGTQVQVLLVSEWGPIAHKDPERSEEIKTGALPSADEGVQLIESTFMGGKGGDFYDLIKRTMETPEDQRTEKDFRFRFFPWFVDDRNTLDGDIAWVPKPVLTYLEGIEAKCKVKLTNGQKLWYFKTKQEQGIFMQREYPSTVEEAFNAPVEGAIYGQIVSEIRAAGHITPMISWDRGSPVFAVWDLGWNDSMSVWLVQMVGRDVVWLWERTARHETMAIMWGEVEKAGITVYASILPHDGSHGNVVSGPVSPKVALEKAGCQKVIVVPVARSIWDGINALRDILARSWFNSEKCEYGLSALEAYHTKDQTTNGVTSRDPVHDWSSHPSSAARTFAEGLEQGLVHPAAARKVLNAPRAPDGSVIVDLEAVRERSQFRRQGRAKSGSTRT